MDASEWEAAGVWASIVIVLGIAVVGWAQAVRASRVAKHANVESGRANEIAADALELAKAAEERADRLERISLERRDVHWTQRDLPDGIGFIFHNAGVDPAHQVRAPPSPGTPAGHEDP